VPELMQKGRGLSTTAVISGWEEGKRWEEGENGVFMVLALNRD